MTPVGSPPPPTRGILSVQSNTCIDPVGSIGAGYGMPIDALLDYQLQVPYE